MVTKMKHRTYRLSSEAITRFLVKNKMIKTKEPKSISAIYEAIKRCLIQEPRIIQGLEWSVYAEELYWLEHTDRDVYFFNDENVVNQLIESSFNIRNFDGFYSGGVESFILALPKDCEINPRGGGFLVTLVDSDEGSGQLYDPFHERLGLPLPSVSRDGLVGKFSVSVNYEDVSGEMAIARLCLDSALISQFLNCKNADEYSQIMSETNAFSYDTTYQVNQDETLNYMITRLVCAFLVYRHALPERIQKGYPQMRKEFGSSRAKNVNVYNVAGPKVETGDTKAGHYRSWHFRQLMNERYYRGEHAQRPIGSRVVFVSDTFIGREVEAKTVT